MIFADEFPSIIKEWIKGHIDDANLTPEIIHKCCIDKQRVYDAIVKATLKRQPGDADYIAKELFRELGLDDLRFLKTCSLCFGKKQCELYLGYFSDEQWICKDCEDRLLVEEYKVEYDSVARRDEIG